MNTGGAMQGLCPPRVSPSIGLDMQARPEADLCAASFRNPIVPGDHPDPAILKDGDDYYMTFSSFQSYPGAVIWQSRDLVDWTPICAALAQPLGTVWAMDLVKHGGRYFIYIPVLQARRVAMYVVHADDMRGPWSEPVDLGLEGCVDPGHAVGEDGRRYLFVNGVRRVGLTDDGLATRGELVHVHTPRLCAPDGEPAAAPEGPKLLRRGGYFYMLSSVGGGCRSSTGHVVTVARSASIHGPWQECPFTPIASSHAQDEPWWLGGHPCLVEGPAGDWWAVQHGYENGHRTLGRQPLLQPVEWTRDGWFRAAGGRLDRRQLRPRGGQTVPERTPLSDDFRHGRLGLQWSFFDAAPGELQRARYDCDGLVLRGKGRGLQDCSPLTCLPQDRSYEAEIEFDVHGAAQGGLALFYDARGHVGIGIGDGRMHTYNYGQEHSWMQQPVSGQRHRLRVTHRKHLVTFHHAAGDGPWTRHPWLKQVSALHQNVLGGFLSLRLALFAAGQGEVRLRRFTYRGLDA